MSANLLSQGGLIYINLDIHHRFHLELPTPSDILPFLGHLLQCSHRVSGSFVISRVRLDHDPFLLGIKLDFFGSGKENINFRGVLRDILKRSRCNCSHDANARKAIVGWGEGNNRAANETRGLFPQYPAFGTSCGKLNPKSDSLACEGGPDDVDLCPSYGQSGHSFVPLASFALTFS